MRDNSVVRGEIRSPSLRSYGIMITGMLVWSGIVMGAEVNENQQSVFSQLSNLQNTLSEVSASIGSTPSEYAQEELTPHVRSPASRGYYDGEDVTGLPSDSGTEQEHQGHSDR